MTESDIRKGCCLLHQGLGGLPGKGHGASKKKREERKWREWNPGRYRVSYWKMWTVDVETVDIFWGLVCAGP